MPRKVVPGLFSSFKGLWARGPIDNTPPDHFSDCQNNIFVDGGVCMRDSMSNYLAFANVRRMALYKPNPPFAGTNIPRIIFLDDSGNLVDTLLNVILINDTTWKDFGFVNFFGRCYISPSDGKVGLSGRYVYLYDGTGVSGFRLAAGAAPVAGITAILSGTPGVLDVGTYLFSYAYETSSGFITQPALPFAYIDSFGSSSVDLTVPVGPVGTVARWVIATQAIPFRQDLSVPFDVGTAKFFPQFFAHRIGDNITTAYNISYYDEDLINSSDYLFTVGVNIPAGVGLIDYKGRMVSYGEYASPSLVRVSEIGNPESFSTTSGFLITDPSDSTGVRSATEFRDNLYFYKEQRGYITQDNTQEASTWLVSNFEKAIGTEPYGISQILDAKGSTSEGYILATKSGLQYFNGTFADPELSYKIRDFWLRINQQYFHRIQVADDPINKRVYILAPLDYQTENSHIIFGDYRDGLNPYKIKWSPWVSVNAPRSILIYTDFTNGIPTVVTRIADTVRINTLNINTPGNDSGEAIESFFQLAPVRFSDGISQFTSIRFRGAGPGSLTITAYGEDKTNSYPATLVLPNSGPGKEYISYLNLVNEYCLLKINCNTLNHKYLFNKIQLYGQAIWDSRPV